MIIRYVANAKNIWLKKNDNKKYMAFFYAKVINIQCQIIMEINSEKYETVVDLFYSNNQ